jgi:hypothetical protein
VKNGSCACQTAVKAIPSWVAQAQDTTSFQRSKFQVAPSLGDIFKVMVSKGFRLQPKIAAGFEKPVVVCSNLRIISPHQVIFGTINGGEAVSLAVCLRRQAGQRSIRGR